MIFLISIISILKEILSLITKIKFLEKNNEGSQLRNSIDDPVETNLLYNVIYKKSAHHLTKKHS